MAGHSLHVLLYILENNIDAAEEKGMTNNNSFEGPKTSIMQGR